MMDPRVTLITLGVRDVARSRAFYEALGWKASGVSQAGVAFFQLNGLALSLYGRDDFARDAEIAVAEGRHPAIALGHNVSSPEAVGVVYGAALAAGATPLKPPHEIFWGGTVAFFADPDGVVWEIAHNPFFPLEPDGNLVLPP